MELSSPAELGQARSSHVNGAGTSKTASGVGYASTTTANSSVSGQWSASSSRLPSHMGNTGPTVRSRITVVCAECKKQKLKCDRNVPCDSCKKRNTVERCIYSAGAAEKVDITSVNNRLKAIENSLSQNLHLNPSPSHPTSDFNSAFLPPLGAPPPPPRSGFPSPHQFNMPHDYPTFLTNESNYSHQKKSTLRLLARNKRGSTVAAPIDGISALWVRECSSVSGHDVQLKAACYAIDDEQRAHGQFPFGVEPLDRQEFPFNAPNVRAKNNPANPDFVLALFGGLMPSQNDKLVDGHLSSDNHASVWDPVVAKLIEKFPSTNLRREILRHYSVNANSGTRCAVPFSAMQHMVEATANAKLCTDPHSCRKNSRCMPLFSEVAEAASAFALGILAWASSSFPVAMDNFPQRGQASDSGASGDTLKPPDVEEAFALMRLAQLALTLHVTRHGYAALDVHYIHAKVLIAQYHLFAHSIRGEAVHSFLSPEMPPHVGSLVCEARMMGLGVDPDSFDPPVPASDLRAGSHDSYFSAHHSDTTPGQDYHSQSQVKQELVEDEDNGSLWRKTPMSVFEKEVRRRLWHSIVWLDFLVADALGYSTVIKPEDYTTRVPSNTDDTALFPDSPSIPLPDHSVGAKNNDFYCTKLRVLNVTFKAPAFFQRSGVATEVDDMDRKIAAQQLADELVRVLQSVPEQFKFTRDNDDILCRSAPPPPMSSLQPVAQMRLSYDDAVLLAQRCDLMINVYHTIMRLFVPRVSLASLSSKQSRQTTSTWSLNNGADLSGAHMSNLRAIEPAILVIRAADVQVKFATHVPPGTFHVFLFCRRVFDAAVVLAFVAIQQPLFTAPIVFESVRAAIGIIRELIPKPVYTEDGTPIRNEVVWTLETMLKEAEDARSGGASFGERDSGGPKKRKHGDLEVASKAYQHHFRYPFMGTGIVTMVDEIRDDAEIQMDQGYSSNLATSSAQNHDSCRGVTQPTSTSTGPTDAHQRRSSSTVPFAPEFPRRSSGGIASSGTSSANLSPPQPQREGSLTTPFAPETGDARSLHQSHLDTPIQREEASSRLSHLATSVQSPEQMQYPIDMGYGGSTRSRPPSETSYDMSSMSSPIYAPSGSHTHAAQNRPPASVPTSSTTYECPPPSLPRPQSSMGDMMPPPQSIISYNDGGMIVASSVSPAPAPGPYSSGVGLMHSMSPFLHIGQRPTPQHVQQMSPGHIPDHHIANPWSEHQAPEMNQQHPQPAWTPGAPGPPYQHWNREPPQY